MSRAEELLRKWHEVEVEVDRLQAEGDELKMDPRATEGMYSANVEASRQARLRLAVVRHEVAAFLKR